MKKVFVFLTVLLALCGFTFAEKNGAYSVKSVTGTVTYELSNGDWANVTAGMSLKADANINVGLNSTLVVELNGESLTIKPMKKGVLADLATANKAGVKVGSRVKKSDIAAGSAKSTKGTATASSRASEAKSDVEWED